MLKEWKELSTDYPGLLSVLTRAKGNVVAYEFPGPYPGKGRPRKRGAVVHLKELFQLEAAVVEQADLWMYEVKKRVWFLSRTYFGGQKLYQELQFVLVEYDGKQIILVSTDQSMDTENIITALPTALKQKRCSGS